MTCPRCRSENVVVHPVTKTWTKHRGCFGWLGWIFLAIITCGLILIIPAITNSRTKSKTRMMGVCQSCGKSWRV